MVRPAYATIRECRSDFRMQRLERWCPRSFICVTRAWEYMDLALGRIESVQENASSFELEKIHSAHGSRVTVARTAIDDATRALRRP